MRKGTKSMIFTAVSLVLTGLLLFAAVMTACDWDFSRLQTASFETVTYEVGEGFRDIRIDTDTALVRFAASEDGMCRVVCQEEENRRFDASVTNGALTVRAVDERKWYEQIGICFQSPEVTVFLPEAEYGLLSIAGSTGDIIIPQGFVFDGMDVRLSTGDVDCRASSSGLLLVKTSTGDILLSNLSSEEINLTVSTGHISVRSVNCGGAATISVSTGKTELADVSCGSLRSTGSTGDISLKNVIAAEMISIERSTGDVRLEKCDAENLTIETDTGDVSGSLLTDKIFLAKTDTGKTDVPETVSGGKCEIRTDTGNIHMEIDG